MSLKIPRQTRGTGSEATKSDLDAMKSGFLLTQSAMDFIKGSMACSKRTKNKQTRPSGIKKSPIIRKQIESSQACKT
jgi:hypothetical protein